MLSHISCRRNVRASGGEDGFVAWLQHDFNGKDQLFACDTVAFERHHEQQAIMLTQLEHGVKLMELVPDVEDCSFNQTLRGRAVVVSDAGAADALHVVHVPSGACSPNMLPPAYRVRALISSPVRPEHLLLVMCSASAASTSHCDDVYRLDLTNGQITLDARNPGFVTQWAADLSTLSIRACVCVHSQQHSASSPAYVKVRGRGGVGPWRHVCELPNGGHVAGFADSGGSLLVMNRAAAADVTFIAEKHHLSPVLSTLGKRHKEVLCLSATGHALALQHNVLFESSSANARAWHCSDAGTFPAHIHSLMHARSDGSTVDVDICCQTPDGQALLIIAADHAQGCANQRTLLLRHDGDIAPFWSYTAPLPPANFLSQSLAIPQSPPLEVSALLPPSATEFAASLPPPAPAVLFSFDTARATAQQRLFSHVLCHMLAENGYVVIKVDSALCSSRRRTQSLVAAAQWAALNRLCAVDRISYLQFGSALDDEDESSLSELFVCTASIRHDPAESPPASDGNYLHLQLSSPTQLPAYVDVERMLLMFNRFAQA